MIVPGSMLLGHNHLYGWYVYVVDKKGVKTTYWHNCSATATREEVAREIKEKFPYVKILKVEPCTKPPDRILKSVPVHHFQHGLLHPDDPEPDDKPIQPLWKPGHALPKFPPLPPRRSLSWHH